MTLALLARLLPLWNWLRSNPLLALCAVLALWGAWEHHRAQGWRDYAHRLESASEAAKRAQVALRAKERADYQEKAHEADTRYATDLHRARDLTDLYIRSHRVLPSSVSPAIPVSEAGDAGKPADLSQAAVVVAEPDVQSAGDWQAYGVACHDFLLSVTQ